MIDEREKFQVQRAMIVFGGSFVHALGKALSSADTNNARKIKETWPEYWQQYKRMAEMEKAL